MFWTDFCSPGNFLYCLLKNQILPTFLLSWKFMVWMIVLLFILFPVAIKEVQWESVGNMVFYTLGHAFIGASFVGNISLCIVEK